MMDLWENDTLKWAILGIWEQVENNASNEQFTLEFKSWRFDC